jgi:hypothetical protein
MAKRLTIHLVFFFLLADCSRYMIIVLKEIINGLISITLSKRITTNRYIDVKAESQSVTRGFIRNWTCEEFTCSCEFSYITI